MTTIKKPWKPTILVAIIVLAGCGGEHEKSASSNAKHTSPKPAEVMTMSRRDITLDKSYPAKLRSNREATVIARVRGVLEVRHFQPGQRVAKGDRLYTIEPNVYQATVDQRKANLKSAQAKALQARRNAQRAKMLIKKHAMSRQEAEETIAQSRVAEAAVAQAKAALESAKIDLGYTNVTAPVAGQIGLNQVNIGNVVDPGTALTIITPLNPLEVRFQLPQYDAFELRRQRQHRRAHITVTLELPGLKGDAATLTGRLDFLGSSVNPKTSTVAAQAVFANPSHLYLPGQFVRVRLEGLKRYNVFAVPEIAVTQGLLGPQVFTLGKNNVTSTTNVKLGEESGPWLIINDGLKTGDRVIVSDPGAIEAGMKIKPRPFTGDATGISAQKTQGQAGRDPSAGAAKTGSGRSAPAGGGG
jgi:membrane fusion protein (multidrug efflux system)